MGIDRRYRDHEENPVAADRQLEGQGAGMGEAVQLGAGRRAAIHDQYRAAGLQPLEGVIETKQSSSIVARETGVTTTFGLRNAEERGQLFVGPGVPVYEGMLVGETPRPQDLSINVCKKKHVTNMRASGSDEALRLIPYKRMSLEECLEFITEDELLEVTPKSLRLRKRILSNQMRMKSISKK